MSKTLVILDINGVLVDKQQKNVNTSAITTPFFKINNNYVVFIRQDVKPFLRELFEKYDVAIFSSTTLRNLIPIVNRLFTKKQRNKLIFLWDRTKTDKDPSPDSKPYETVKYLSKVKEKYPYDKMVICDDSASKIRFNSPKEKIIVPAFSYLVTEKNVLQALLQLLAKKI